MASPSQWHALSLHTYGPWADSPDKILEDSLDKVVKPKQIAEYSLDRVVADSRVKVGKDASDDLRGCHLFQGASLYAHSLVSSSRLAALVVH